MSDAEEFALVLTDETTFSGPPGSSMDGGMIEERNPLRDQKKNSEIEDGLKIAIKAAGGSFNSSSEHRIETPQNDRFKTHFPADISITTDQMIYACGSLAAFAVFARNVVGAVKDWRDLRAGRYVKLKFRGKEITVERGTDIEKVLAEHTSNDET